MLVSVKQVGGDPAVTDGVTVTSGTAAVTPPTGSACATRGTRVSSVTSPVKLGSMEVGVK